LVVFGTALPTVTTPWWVGVALNARVPMLAGQASVVVTALAVRLLGKAGDTCVRCPTRNLLQRLAARRRGCAVRAASPCRRNSHATATPMRPMPERESNWRSATVVAARVPLQPGLLYATTSHWAQILVKRPVNNAIAGFLGSPHSGHALNGSEARVQLW